MQTGKIIGLILGVFLAGAVAGGFAGARWQQSKAKPSATEGEKPKSREDEIMCWMREFLQLNAEQEEQIRPLVRQAIGEYQVLQKEQQQRIYDLIDRSDRKIAEHLTKEQAEKLFAFNRDRREVPRRNFPN